MFGYNNHIVQKDIKELINTNFQWFHLNNKRFLITGANGMLATYLIYTLMSLKKEKGLNIKVVALSRNLQKLQFLFKDFLEDKNFEIISQDVSQPIQCIGRIDYIFHFAGNASPYYINNEPVEIMKSNLLGTFNVLELARDKEPEKIIFASTREVYGKVEDLEKIKESDFGILDPLDDRSCYPESKRAAESILKSYYLEYKIPFNSVRIAHSYGPGMKLENDGRVMADFISNVVHKEDIILHSTGEALRSFCYISDAIQGLFQVLLYGKIGKAYNLANETEPYSIKEIAQMLANLYPERNISVKFELKTELKGYCNYKRTMLDTTSIESIGWQPSISIKEGLKRTVDSFINNK